MGTNFLGPIASHEGQRKWLAPLRQGSKPAPEADQALKRACCEFEALFLLQLWRVLQATVPTPAKSFRYVEMFDMNFADYLSRVGRFGLGEQMYQQLTRSLSSSGIAPHPSQSEEGLSNER